MTYDPTASAGSHAMLLYRGPREHLLACTKLVNAGTAAGAAVLVAVTREHLDGLDSQRALDTSGAVLCDLTSQGADPGRVLSLIRMFARENAGRPVRCVQDVGWLGRPDEHLTEAIGYEALLRDALAESPADVMCCYDARLDADLLTAAEREHTVASGGLDDRVLSRPPGGASALTFRAEQGEVRSFTADQARAAGLPPDKVTDLVIAIGELAGNTWLHTNSTGTLTIWTTDDEIVCQVTDSGQITDPLAGTLRPEPDDLGSRRGLWLVHEVSDLVQVRTGSWGTTVRVHMRLPARETGPVSAGRVHCRDR